MNQRDWIRLLTPGERRVLSFALADQDRLLDKEGESAYYANVVSDIAETVELEQVRQGIIEELSVK